MARFEEIEHLPKDTLCEVVETDGHTPRKPAWEVRTTLLAIFAWGIALPVAQQNGIVLFPFGAVVLLAYLIRRGWGQRYSMSGILAVVGLVTNGWVWFIMTIRHLQDANLTP